MNKTDMPVAGSRRRLPNRRFSENRRLVWAGRTIFVSIGYAPEDHREPREIFYSGGYRRGSDMEALVSDLCVFLSVWLQQEGVTAETVRESMSETFDVRTGDPMPASILGLLLEELSRPPEWADALAQAEGADAASGEGTETREKGG